ncbi:hypothetical protein [Atopomonas sediminilitoris]|uniref:hypothetical protein n=1 Tax=Atopomonas sediminilitoris TaxID=2919919 RepID=UPI001F4E92C4|nr:hypothetical protein [Atopomonas sediminilitoris]MCJ8169702.1 hypothetical protein [Atopomonas sediminilitoris]
MRAQLLVSLGLSLLPSLGAANEPLPPAHIASPEHYQVLLENERVLVLKMVLKPGDADQPHRHGNETVYFQQGGQLTIQEYGGQTIVADVPDGHVMWHGAWQHQVSNSGDREVVAIIVEEKALCDIKRFP